MMASDIDSLHILPLTHIPLQTQSLRRARLAKNARLESMVELFGDSATGRGQIVPEQLHAFFDLSGDRERDFDIICGLGDLPSYDFYSLRVSLRRLGIAIDDLEGLKLSPSKVAELSTYMADFTRPLVRFVYGDTAAETQNLADLLRLFAQPDESDARGNLREMAYQLGVELSRIPKFLEDYADVFMSLSFYRQCLEKIAPMMSDFLDTLHIIRNSRAFAHDAVLLRDCIEIERKLNRLFDDVAGVLDDFRRRTEHMWENLSADYYRQMERMVLDQQMRIGEILCALTVKMTAWDAKFPVSGDTQLSAKAAFVIAEMKHGLSSVQPLTPPQPVAAPARIHASGRMVRTVGPA